MRPPFWTVPNQITFLRFVLLPVFLICLFYQRYGWALLLLVTAAATDALDGLLARWLNQKSELGMFLDPLADKFMLSGAFVVLAFRGVLGWWLTILVLARDAIILATGAVILLVVGPRTFPPSLVGKLTTGLQILLILLVVSAATFQLPALHAAQRVLVYAVAAATIVSGVHYSIVIARRLNAPS
ncbi:MAG TPA: CDP-alcohol phosphatidyltransferase family protein [Candidatus Acidoferrales bacterium]|nr:CDP-alcohol phosphatidyltransferase family protein [Candidatus Acidoferrales bacterium]